LIARAKNSVKLIQISEKLYFELFDLTRMESPKESCALIFGRILDQVLMLEQSNPMNNVCLSRDRFAMVKREYDEVVSHHNEMSKAIYHSHLNGTYASQRDIAGIQSSGLPWVIGSLNNGSSSAGFRIEAYLARGGRVYIIPIRREK